jgi:uncharacterized protein
MSMINIDCKNCDGRCCTSRKRKLFVVLTPQEIDKYKDFSTNLDTENYKLTILKKDNSGNCIFYDEKENLCKSYLDRPFECRMYPCIIIYDKEVKLKIDKMVCPKTDDCPSEKLKQIKQEWLDQNLPLNWIKAYSEFD